MQKSKTDAENQMRCKNPNHNKIRLNRDTRTKHIAIKAGTWKCIGIESKCTALSGICESKIAEVECSALMLLGKIEAVDIPKIALREVSLVSCEQAVDESGDISVLGS